MTQNLDLAFSLHKEKAVHHEQGAQGEGVGKGIIARGEARVTRVLS